MRIISVADLPGAEDAIRAARDLNPNIEILARTGYLRGVPAARQAGANAVFPGEGEVALALVSAILQNLGATPEQIERERDRVHMETNRLSRWSYLRLAIASPPGDLATRSGSADSISRSILPRSSVDRRYGAVIDKHREGRTWGSLIMSISSSWRRFNAFAPGGPLPEIRVESDPVKLLDCSG